MFFHKIRPVSIDSKGRLAIPTCFRDDMASAGDKQLVLTMSLHSNGCLWLYPRQRWEEDCQRVLQDRDQDGNPIRPTRARQRAKMRLLSMAEPLEPDASWRILLPSEHRDAAGLDREARFTGSGTRFEIWSLEALAKMRGDDLDALDDVFEDEEFAIL